MYARILGALSVVALVSCGGGDGSNPITGGSLGGADQPTDPTDPNTNPAEKYAFDLDDGLVMNDLDYDAAADQLVINNIPFDTTTGIYERTGTLPNGWGLYQNDERGTSGRIPYYATFLRSASGDTQAAAVASGGFLGEGNVGATAQRTNSSVTLPVTGILAYNGTYAGVRELGESVAGGPDVELVAGDAIVNIDFDDFDITGDIVGFVINRIVYDANTLAPVGSLANLSLAEAFIDRSNATIDSSAAVSVDGTLTGSWEGVFGGSNGQEIAAYLVVSGTSPLETDGGGVQETVREIGALIVSQ